MDGIISAAIDHARTVILSLVLILVAGTVCYLSIPKEASPDINAPVIYVSVAHDGISPADSENQLLKPMEQELKSIEGVKEMRSTAYQGGGYVILEFDVGFDVDVAIADVRDKVDRVKAELPDDADEPTVNEVNLSLFPILTVNLSGEVSQRTLIELAEDLQEKIEAIDTVLEAEVVGSREEKVELVVDPLSLESYGLDAENITESILRSNRVVAAGSLDTGRGRFSVQVPGLIENLQDILDLPIKTDGDAVVAVKDVAALRPTFEDASEYARVNGQSTVALEISKRTGTNVIETAESVRKVVRETTAYWPRSVGVSFSRDKSIDIHSSLLDLQNNVISAIIIVMIVVVAALGLRSGALVGITIPGAFLMSFVLLYIVGLTINTVVLFGLILSVGMIVDGAIVVTELADRKMSEGLHRKKAYAIAAQRTAWPIISSTATTLAAFAPLLFWPGMAGEFMKYVPITLLTTLSASLVMALIAVPTLGSIIGKPGSTADPKALANLIASESGDITKLTGSMGYYAGFLRWCLKRPFSVIMLAFLILVGSFVLYGKFGNGIEFFPSVDPERLSVNVRTQGNFSLDEKDHLVRQVEDTLLQMHAEKGEFYSLYTTSFADTPVGGKDRPEDVIGTIQIELTDWFLRRPADSIVEELRARTENLAGITVEAIKDEAGPSEGKPIEIHISSSEPDLVYGSAAKVAERLRQIDGLVDIEDGLPLPGIEWRLEVNRAQASKFGADVALIGDYVRMITNGAVIGSYRPDNKDEEIDIIVRLPFEQRNLDHLDQIKIQTSAGQVPLSNFVQRIAVPKVSLINRVDSRRTVTVKAGLVNGVLADNVVKELEAWTKTQEWDPRLSIEFLGENEDQEEAGGFLVKAFGLALFLIAIILVTQFNSFYDAFLILSAVIMSTAGVMLGLLVIQQPFSIVMSGIGVVALAGIVVNNNIVLIDTHNNLRECFDDPMEVILRTGAQRLRPVFLTTFTTILGLIPMALATNIDLLNGTVLVGAPSTQWWQQLATAIAVGLCFATPLTLVVTPCALMARVRTKLAFRRLCLKLNSQWKRAERDR